MKTHDEFLEELIDCIISETIPSDEAISQWSKGANCAFGIILLRIKRFQAEQKANDENRT